jgi:hypothetical protein
VNGAYRDLGEGLTNDLGADRFAGLTGKEAS